uniref:hypothetical protein n=1 Tax=uncultured Draconibacterium sp. TaxID=1573823 RepID=UPI00321687F2
MKKIVFVITGLVFFASQIFAQDTNKENNPDEQIIVNKEYDENGNLIQYDSTYIHQWSSADSTLRYFFPDDPFSSGKECPDMEQFFKEFHGKSNWAIISDIDELLQDFQNQFQSFPDSVFNRRSPQFQSLEQQKEWQQLMEKHSQEIEEFRKKWENKGNSIIDE